MKRSTIILVTFLTYFIAIIIMFWGVSKHIEKKDNRLSGEIYTKLNEAFDGREYIDISYSGYKVGYETMDIPKKPGLSEISIFSKKSIDEWQEVYGDLSKMYRLKYVKSNFDNPFTYENGWKLIKLVHDEKGYFITHLFPYAVGYIKQNYSWGNEYLPSVQTAVNEAFEFFTTDSKSNFIANFEKGSCDRIMNKIFKCSNDYYFITQDSVPRMWFSGVRSIDGGYTFGGREESPYQITYMYNGYYKVFIAETQPQTYSIKKYGWNPDELEKRKLLKKWAIILTISLLLIVIPMWIVDIKHRKLREESIYEKLLRTCNPVNFLKDYNKEKVDKANDIYKKLLEIEPNNQEALKEIQILAVTELGINLIEKENLEDLKEKVNPKNFMSPYNAEKVSIANDLYSRLSKENLTFDEYSEIEEISKRLFIVH